MKVTTEFVQLGPEIRSAVTLGKFDGLHRGHQKLVNRVLALGREGYETAVFAFDASSRTLLTKQERRQMLEERGIGLLIECPLNRHVMHMTAEAFVKEILVERLHIAHVVVGPDFHFGYQRKGNAEFLKRMGEQLDFQVEVLDKEMDGNRKISSTYVREQLNEGNMEKLEELLGYRFSTTGQVLHGRGLGHKIGIPTTNLIPPKEKLMPPNGVYVSLSYFGSQVFGGITNVGYKPTVGGEDFLGVETYLFHCSQNLYGQQSKVSFLKFLRPERKFSSLEALVKQLREDVRMGEAYFAKMHIEKKIHEHT